MSAEGGFFFVAFNIGEVNFKGVYYRGVYKRGCLLKGKSTLGGVYRMGFL